MIVLQIQIAIGLPSFQYTRKVIRVISLVAKNFLRILIHIMMLRSVQTCAQLTLIVPCFNSEEFNILIQDGVFFSQSAKQVHHQINGMFTKLFQDYHHSITIFARTNWLILIQRL